MSAPPRRPVAPTQQILTVLVDLPFGKDADRAPRDEVVSGIVARRRKMLVETLEKIQRRRPRRFGQESDHARAPVDEPDPGHEPVVPVRKEMDPLAASVEEEHRRHQHGLVHGAVVGGQNEGIAGGEYVLQALDRHDAARGDERQPTQQDAIGRADMGEITSQYLTERRGLGGGSAECRRLGTVGGPHGGTSGEASSYPEIPLQEHDVTVAD